MGLVSAPFRLAGRGIGAVGKGIGGARANAGAVAGDLIGLGRDDPLEERDPDFIRATLPSNRQLANVLFRPKVSGLGNIPSEGPVLLVGNHSGGTMIIDTFVFSFAFYRHFGPGRRFHQLAHDLAVKFPGLSALLRKYGTLPASHEYAERALEEGAAVLVYPGGDFESFRPSWHSDQVEFGGRSGFIRLALAQDVPIVPVVAIGGQESALFVTRGERLARLLMLDKLLRIKVLPVIIGPPFGISLLDLPPRLPLPSQVTIRVLEAIDLRERFGSEPDEDEVYEALTETMQEALDELAEERDLPLVGAVWSDRRGDEGAAEDGAGRELDDDEASVGETEDGAVAEDLRDESAEGPTQVRLAPGGPPVELAAPPQEPDGLTHVAGAAEAAEEPEAAEEREAVETSAAADTALTAEVPAAPDAPTVPEVAAVAAASAPPAAPSEAAAPSAPPAAPADVPSAAPAIEEESSTLVAEFAEPGAEDGAGAELHVEEPWKGYSRMRVGEVSDRLAAESNEVLLAVQLYEQTHKSRRGVLDAIGRELKRR